MKETDCVAGTFHRPMCRCECAAWECEWEAKREAPSFLPLSRSPSLLHLTLGFGFVVRERGDPRITPTQAKEGERSKGSRERETRQD